MLMLRYFTSLLITLALALSSSLPVLAAETGTMSRSVMRRSSGMMNSTRPAMLRHVGRRSARGQKYMQSKNRRSTKHRKRMMQMDTGAATPVSE